jgi:anti-sigma factor ChrR (cupin superfamily)
MTAASRTGCEHLERVAELALRALPSGEARAIEAHVAECPACRAELAALEPVADALVDWPVDILRPPAPLWGRLAERIGAGPAEEPESRWTAEPAWREVAPGISCKLLATDAASDRVSMLVRLAPGVAYPAHDHAGVEELFLLDGELWIEDRKLLPGDHNRAEPGTGDTRVWSETGCTCVLVTSFRDVLR